MRSNRTNKRIAVLLVLLLCVYMLVGCGGTAKVEGTTWTLTGGKLGGENVSRNQIVDEFGEITYHFKSGGIVTFTFEGGKGSGKYNQNKSHVTIDNGHTKLVGVIHGNKMTFKREEISITMEFTKKNS